MIEKSEENLAKANRWMGALPRDQFDLLLLLTDQAMARGKRDGLARAAQIAADTELPEEYIWSDANREKFNFGAQSVETAIRTEIKL